MNTGLSQNNVDGLLESFFKSELPEPWPAPAVVPLSAHRTFWFRSYRLGLVASLALFLLSYVVLAARFPAQSEPGLGLDRSHTIGFKQRVPTPRGGEALLWEQRVPSTTGQPTIIIQVQEIKGPTSPKR
jgi:hypothetical protein